MMSSSEAARSRFAPVRFRDGYDMREVDRLLARVGDTLASYEQSTDRPGRLTAADVVNSRFQPTKFRSGYSQDEVDAFLDQVVVALRSYEGSEPTIL